MKRVYDFLREKGFYLALGVGIVAFAALIFLYDYKEAGDELTREQAIDLNKARTTEDIADASDAEEDVQTDKDNDSKKETKDNVAKAEDNKTDKKGDNTSVNNEDGADGEEIQNIRGMDTSEVADAANNQVTEDVQTADNSDKTTESGDKVVETASNGTIASAIEELDYDGSQGLLWPLSGDVIMPFSMDTTTYYKTLDMYKVNPGILIASDEGGSVFSAYEGIVEEVKDTKEYGTEVIVNLGNGYKAIYGQLMNIAVKPGDEVAKATIIGQVAPVSDYFKKEGSNLFFEVTKDGVPVNPVTLID